VKTRFQAQSAGGPLNPLLRAERPVTPIDPGSPRTRLRSSRDDRLDPANAPGAGPGSSDGAWLARDRLDHGHCPTAAEIVDLGQAQVTLNTGGLRIDQPLDFDQSPAPTSAATPRSSTTPTPSTSGHHPGAACEQRGRRRPDDIQVQLTFNGVAQGWTEYDTSDHDPGDDYLITAQVDQAVARAGCIPGRFRSSWTSAAISPTSTSGSRAPPGSSSTIRPLPIPMNLSRASTSSAPAGHHGHRAPGAQRRRQRRRPLGRRLRRQQRFTRNSDGSFTSPPDDFGTLVENDDHTFTYTAPDQTLYEFNTLGLLTSVAPPDGLDTTYKYTDEASSPGDRFRRRRHDLRL